MATSTDILTVQAGETERPILYRKELVAVGRVTGGQMQINASPTWAQQWSREQCTAADMHGEPTFSDE